MFPLAFFPPFSHIFLGTVVLWIAAEWIGGFRQRGSPAPPALQDQGSYLLLIASIWLGAFLALWTSLLLPRAAVRVDRPALFFAGIAIMLAGIGLRWYANQHLRQGLLHDLTNLNGNEQRLQPKGAYRYVRHPGYSGSLLIYFGIGLTLANFASLIVLMVSVVLGHVYRVRAEEDALVKRFGRPYREYMRRTASLIPFLL